MRRRSRARGGRRDVPARRATAGAMAVVTIVALLGLFSGIGGRALAQVEGGVLAARAGEPQPAVRARDLARIVGASLRQEDDLIVLRADGVALTAFAGSTAAIVADGSATEIALSAPAVREGDAWWLPLDAGAPFGLRRTSDAVVVTASGRSWRLAVASEPAPPPDPRARRLEPVPGVVALELRDRPASAGAAERAVWIADLALVPLLAPELRGVIDEALSGAGSVRALLLLATSRRSEARFEGITVDADGRRVVDVGARLETLSGRPDDVRPESPWVAVVWLPPGTRLDRPLTIGWEGASSVVTFRQ